MANDNQNETRQREQECNRDDGGLDVIWNEIGTNGYRGRSRECADNGAERKLEAHRSVPGSSRPYGDQHEAEKAGAHYDADDRVLHRDILMAAGRWALVRAGNIDRGVD